MPPEAADLKEAVLPSLKDELGVVFKTEGWEGHLGTRGGTGGGLSKKAENKILTSNLNKEYAPIGGEPTYGNLSADLGNYWLYTNSIQININFNSFEGQGDSWTWQKFL